MFTQNATERETTECLPVVTLQTMKTAFDRLMQAAQELEPEKPMTKARLKMIIGESAQTITNWQTRGVPQAKITSLARAVKVLPDWLETGSGPKTLGEVSASALIPAGAAISTYEDPEDLDLESYVWIDRYDVRLSAGCGNIQWVVNAKDPISFRARWFQTKHLNPDECKALYVRGRSMEPKLEDWDTVLIDISQIEIIDGEIYAVCLKDKFFIKTVQRLADGILLKSENPEFENIEVRGEQLDQLCIIGKKVWRGG